MLQKIKLSEATAAYRRVYFVAVDPSDLKTRKTGLGSFTVKRSKNGAAGGAGGGTVTEVDATNLPGVYYYECSTGDIDTLGSLVLVITQASMETREIAVTIGSDNSQDSISSTLLAAVVDGGAPANAQTLKQILNIMIAALTGPVTIHWDSDGSITILGTDGVTARIVGTITGGARALTSLDGR